MLAEVGFERSWELSIFLKNCTADGPSWYMISLSSIPNSWNCICIDWWLIKLSSMKTTKPCLCMIELTTSVIRLPATPVVWKRSNAFFPGYKVVFILCSWFSKTLVTPLSSSLIKASISWSFIVYFLIIDLRSCFSKLVLSEIILSMSLAESLRINSSML